MTATRENRNRSTPHLRWIFLLSLVIHGLLLFHIHRAYRSTDLNVIELSLNTTDQTPPRAIPRPRMVKSLPETRDVSPVTPSQKIALRVPADPAEVGALEQIPNDVLAPAKGLLSPDKADLGLGQSGDYFTRNDYMEMVRLKIESRKAYPEEAKKRAADGRVVVQFLITRDGQISSLKIKKSARNDTLDQAALKAVQEASPFSPPPAHLFKKPLFLELAIVFEIT